MSFLCAQGLAPSTAGESAGKGPQRNSLTNQETERRLRTQLHLHPCLEGLKQVWGQENGDNGDGLLVARLLVSGEMELNQEIWEMLGSGEVR